MKSLFRVSALALAAFLAGEVSGALAQPAKQVPYWASISQAEARMRVGPSLDYPSNWLYRRRDLPVKVVMVLGNWRKIEDPDGAQGWMHVRLLSDTRTAIVRAGGAELRAAPNAGAPLLYRAEAGVVGRLSDCGKGWCKLSIEKRSGFARVETLWGGTE